MAEKSGGQLGIFDYTEYRAYLRNWIQSAPNRGRGQLTRLSEAARIHKTTLSQIFSGTKELSLEQAHEVAQYLSLNRAETEYFILLVEHERAGSVALRRVFRAQIDERREQRRQLSHRVTRSRELTNEERAIYYSNWIYSAVRNLTAIEAFTHAPEIGRRLSLEPTHLARVLEFLIQTGLCIEKGNRLAPGPQMTHLEAASPLVARHHGNWRIKAMERHPVLRDSDELAYTAPMTLSTEDAAKIRALLADLVEEADRIVGPSPSERLFCMCLDWFEVR